MNLNGNCCKVLAATAMCDAAGFLEVLRERRNAVLLIWC